MERGDRNLIGMEHEKNEVQGEWSAKSVKHDGHNRRRVELDGKAARQEWNAGGLQRDGKERRIRWNYLTSIVAPFVDVLAVPEQPDLPAQYSLQALRTPHAGWKSSRQWSQEARSPAVSRQHTLHSVSRSMKSRVGLRGRAG
jgi:hypothetical protein